MDVLGLPRQGPRRHGLPLSAPGEAEGRNDDAAAWLRTRAAGVRAWLALAIAWGLLGTAATIAQAGLIAHLAHAALVTGAGPGALTPALALLLGAAGVRALAEGMRQSAGIAASTRVRQRLRAELLEHIGRLGPVRLADVPSGALAGRVVEQVDALDGYFARFLPQRALAVLAPLAMLATVASLDWLAALLLAVAAPLIPLFMALVGMGAARLNRDQYETMTRLAGHFADRVRGLRTLRLFGAGDRARDEVARVSEEFRARSMRTLRVAFVSSAVLEFFSAVAIAMVAIYIGFGLLGYIAFGPAPELTLFSGLFVLLLAPEFFQPLRSLAQHYHDRAAALGAAPDLVALLARPAPAPVSTPTDGAAAADVSVHGLAAGHPGRGRVLDDLSFDVPAGARMAVIGPSGSGKSTLLHVLAGFIDAEAGDVRIAGGPPGRPGQTAWVDQRPFIRAGSIADNIRLGRPQASEADIRAAADAAGVLTFARALPDGLAATLGERGHGLSGGQAQRVALARAFVSRAPVLLLDEPTAGLDADAETAVIEALERLTAAGRTAIIATHHPRLRAAADRVLDLAPAGTARPGSVPTDA